MLRQNMSADQDFLTPEPEYIEESAEIQILRETYPSEVIGIQKGHWSLGLTLLTNTLYLVFGSTSFSKLVDSVAKNANMPEKFLGCMNDVVSVNNWSHQTALTAVSAMKKIMAKTDIPEFFLNRLTIEKSKTISRISADFCIPAQYKKRPETDRVRQTLVDLVKKCKQTSRYKSQSCLRVFISYIVKLLDFLEIKITDYVDILKVDMETLMDAVGKIQPNMALHRKLMIVQILLCNVLGESKYMETLKMARKNAENDRGEDILDDGSDKHRLSSDELELMYQEARNNPRNHALFLLLISTGMRAYGASNVKLEHVIIRTNDKIVVKESGRTLEKGNKWFTFMISPKLSEVLHTWITKHRKGVSSYLFPGRGENIGISPARINAIIKEIGTKVGITGEHLHVHSLRHSHAHILLECGNSVDTVSKMLGHASSKTTEKYYLRESAAEVSKRSNIPWLERKQEVNPVPAFMVPDKPTQKKVVSKTCKKEALKILRELRNIPSTGQPAIQEVPDEEA